jgi:hypothetical protein
VSSRLVVGRHGELLVMVTTPSVGLPTGMVFIAIGNSIAGNIGWLGHTKARAPTAQERTERRGGAASRRAAPPVVPDELLEPAAAIEAARVEQERRPVDVLANWKRP